MIDVCSLLAFTLGLLLEFLNAMYYAFYFVEIFHWLLVDQSHGFFRLVLICPQAHTVAAN